MPYNSSEERSPAPGISRSITYFGNLSSFFGGSSGPLSLMSSLASFPVAGCPV